MTVEAATPIQRCDGQGCANVADLYGLCSAHRRALKLTTKIQDALLEFVTGIRPLTKNDRNILSASDYLSDGLTMLVGSVFGEEIEFERRLIVVDYGDGEQRRPRWRVDLKWRIADMGDDDE
ncbi:hypothetical protein [Mycobacterium intracellulare]|uniref:hypothetical protein n=1 Tax=Mycobacterium intracellulare TaxID=1767 RepID=UPI0034D30E2B